MGAPWDSALNLWGTAMANNTRTGESSVVRKNLSQEAIDKLIYDALSSDQGIAALALGENLSGGFKSSSKTLMAQDMMTKLIGELAAVTAETETEKKGEQTTKEGRFLNKFADDTGTVICTELYRQGKLSPELYALGGPPSRQVSYHTWKGYHIWATKVVARMRKSEQLSNFLLPIVVARYEHLIGIRKNLLGALTIYIGHPICNMIGHIVDFGGSYGRSQSAS